MRHWAGSAVLTSIIRPALGCSRSHNPEGSVSKVLAARHTLWRPSSVLSLMKSRRTWIERGLEALCTWSAEPLSSHRVKAERTNGTHQTMGTCGTPTPPKECASNPSMRSATKLMLTLLSLVSCQWIILQEHRSSNANFNRVTLVPRSQCKHDKQFFVATTWAGAASRKSWEVACRRFLLFKEVCARYCTALVSPRH